MRVESDLSINKQTNYRIMFLSSSLLVSPESLEQAGSFTTHCIAPISTDTVDCGHTRVVDRNADVIRKVE